MDIFEKIYRPEAEHCTEAGLLRMLEDAATAHAIRLGIDHDRLLSRYGCVWMLSRSWYRVPGPPRAGEALRIQTWVSAAESSWGSWRAHRIGESGESLELWVLADVETRKLVPISRIPMPEGAALEAGRTLPPKVPPLRGGEPIGSFTVEEADLDINGHMNNTRYVRRALALLRGAADCPDFFPELRVTYSRECRLGEAITLTAERRPEGFLLCGCGPEGKPRFGVWAQSRE